MSYPAKFVPVNPNKSHGRNSSSSVSASGPHAPSRYGRHGGNPVGGGGGMVVLSRPKAAPKLSVPPPLNLPSLRKEHERFDSNGSNSIPGRQGLGHAPGSSTMRWTKPAAVENSPVPDPAAGPRPGGPSVPASTSQDFTAKVVILKGEDFPTLRAATYTPPSKPQDGSNRIEKKVTSDEGMERRPLSPMLMDMRPQMRRPRSGAGNSLNEGKGAGMEKPRKADEPLSGLPRVDYKSDWEEDERKINLSLPERGLGGNVKHETAHDTIVRDVEAGASKEVYRGDPFGKYSSAYVNKNNRDSLWRSAAMNQRGDRYGSHDSDRHNDTRPYITGRGNYTQSIYSGNRDWHLKQDPITYLEDVVDIGDVNVKVLKKKRELQPTEFHDPQRESFEAELDKILRMQEMERQRAINERNRALEMARREEEERERMMREEQERLAREEEEARRAAWLAEQEKLDSARRVEEQRIAREEERRRLLLEEERRKEAARKKLLELEARIARRQAETHSQGENNDNTTVRLEPKDVPVAGESFNSFKDQEYPYLSPAPAAMARRDVFGPGPVRRSYGRKDQQPYGNTRMQRWENNPGFNRPQSDFESDYLEGDRLGDAGWSSPSNSMGSPHAQYDTNGSFSSFTRYRYGTHQPRVLPPPAVTSIYRGPITERTGPSTSLLTTGRDHAHSMGTSYADVYQETSQSHIIEEQSEEKAGARCGSQSSLSVSSPPLSPPHVSHDEMDVSGDLPAPPTSAETPQSYNENGEIDGTLDLSDAITDVEDEEWGPAENADEMNHPVEYEGEEEEGDVGVVTEQAGANLDLQREFEDVTADTEQIILGFDQGVQVQIHRGSSEFENQKAVEMDSGPSVIVKEPINELVDKSTLLMETENAIRDLSLEQPIKSVSYPLMPSQDKLANVSGLPTPIMPPMKPIMPPSSTQIVPSHAEMPLNLQFGLFSGPSLIPTPIPAIQIGSIQMPIHLHTHTSIPQMHSPATPLFQFGQLQYAPTVVSQQSFVHPAGPSNSYVANQNKSFTNATVQKNPVVNLSQVNIMKASQSSVPTNSLKKESDKPKERASLISSDNKEHQVQLQPNSNATRVSNGSKGPIIVSAGARGKRYGYNNNPHREHNMKFVPAGSEIPCKDLRGGYRRTHRTIRRTEHRVRDNNERRDQAIASEFSNQERIDERNGGEIVSGTKDNPQPKDDVLEGRVVRVFEQPGIEVLTDADGFIEVRSKKQMLNDRREKREREKEKEIRPKPRMQKVSRKQNFGAGVRSVGSSFKRTTKEVIQSTGKNLPIVQPSVPLTGNSASKSLPPIGTPAQKLPDPDAGRSSLKTKQPTQIGLGLSLEGTTVAEKPLALGSWGSSQTNQQVMPLTQSQLEEAMKPVQFDQQSASNTFSLEPSKPISSAQQKPSPITSLLAGENIQFGEVTSSAILSVSRPAAPNGLGAPGSSRPVPPMKTELPPMYLFDQGNLTAEEPVAVSLEEEGEDEAEAAASAVAVAAISNDEVPVGTVVDSSVPAKQTNICSADASGSTSGAVGRGTRSQSITTEESSLSVALPADLSVDTSSLTMWPALPSPQSTGPNPMLSQFPGGQPSHFSCFEMNPMLGGAHHNFAFGPHDESAAQSHAQRAAAGGQLGTWSGPLPTGNDSFYCPPAGYGGPFISPGGIQAPPHMVVYNHFTPVGQFGQVGLSFVGPATYIPTEKHPDWKHLPHTHSVAPAGQGDVNCQNMGPGAGVSQGMPVPGQGQIPHLRPSAPLVQLPMFDILPFQPTGEMLMPNCWPRMPPGPPLQSGPHSMPPIQQHQMDRHLGHNNKNQPVNNGPHFAETPVNSDNRRAPQFPDELGLVEGSLSTTRTVGTQPVLSALPSNDEGSCAKPVMKPPASAVVNVSEKDPAAASNTAGTIKGQHATVIDRRGKNEWHRRGGYNHGRKPSSGQDKAFGTGTGRMKQIYVAKSSVTGSTSTPTTVPTNN